MKKQNGYYQINLIPLDFENKLKILEKRRANTKERILSLLSFRPINNIFSGLATILKSA